MTSYRRSKLRNIPTVVDGIRFASKKEARRWCELCLLERAGAIRNLRRQVVYQLAVNGHPICKYVPDFVYYENGLEIIEDVKGQKSGVPYQLFTVKRKLLFALYGLEVIEI